MAKPTLVAPFDLSVQRVLSCSTVYVAANLVLSLDMIEYVLICNELITYNVISCIVPVKIVGQACTDNSECLTNGQCGDAGTGACQCQADFTSLSSGSVCGQYNVKKSLTPFIIMITMVIIFII